MMVVISCIKPVNAERQNCHSKYDKKNKRASSQFAVDMNEFNKILAAVIL